MHARSSSSFQVITGNSLCKLQSAMKPPAHFFKFIRTSPNSYLSIPISFRKYLESTRKHEVAILRRGDQKWAVKIGGDWMFGEGWDEFMTENGVQDFDVVVFKHEGNLVFDIKVFDTTWCEKEYSNDQVTKSSRKQKVDNNELKISKGKDTCKNQSTKSLHKAENSSKTTIPNQNHHPYFDSILKQYGPFKSLYIPKKFAVANGLNNGEMILKNVEKEGLWTAHLRSSLGNYFYVGQGWHGFCDAIGLVEGDSFRFELIDNGKKPVAIISRLSTNTNAKVTNEVIPKAALANPYFRSTVTAYIIKSAIVNVPLAFAKSNKLAMRDCELFVMDEKQRLWPTRVRGSGCHVRIHGLRDLLVANGLKKGDVFLLELVDNGNKPLMNLYSDGSASLELT